VVERVSESVQYIEGFHNTTHSARGSSFGYSERPSPIHAVKTQAKEMLPWGRALSSTPIPPSRGPRPESVNRRRWASVLTPGSLRSAGPSCSNRRTGLTVGCLLPGYSGGTVSDSHWLPDSRRSINFCD
jgi:hypothetical protein